MRVPIENVKLAFDGVKFIKEMFNGHVDGLAKEKVQELHQQLNNKVIDIQQVLLELLEQNQTYQQRNDKLEKQLNEQMDFQNKLLEYELVKSKGGAVVYKFRSAPEHFLCQRCISEKKLIIILQFNDNYNGFYHCPCCEQSFKIEKTPLINDITTACTSYDPKW